MRNSILAIAIAFVLAAPSGAFAGEKKPFQFGDIKGESTDKDHKDWIMLRSSSPSPRPGITTQGNILQKSGGVGSPVKSGYDLKANKGR